MVENSDNIIMRTPRYILIENWLHFIAIVSVDSDGHIINLMAISVSDPIKE